MNNSSVDPVQLAERTLRSIETIGRTMADEIDNLAQGLRAECDVQLESLAKLKEAVLKVTSEEAEHLSIFKNRLVSVAQSIDALSSSFVAAQEDDGKPIPAFLKERIAVEIEGKGGAQ